MVVQDYAAPLCEKVFQKYGTRVNVIKLTDAKNGINYDESLQARSPYAHKISNLSMHITDHAFATIVGRQVENEYKNYIKFDPIDVSSFNLPERFIVITTGFTSETREWLPEHVNGVTDWLLSQNIIPVYLGKSYTPAFKDTGIIGNFKADYSRGLNLIDKTNLFEAHAIMQKALCTLGIDNGLLHLGSMGDAKIVWGFTTVEPLHRLPYRNSNQFYNNEIVYPEKELACMGCQSNLNFAPITHDFRFCIYNDLKCLSLMTADKWIEKIERILK